MFIDTAKITLRAGKGGDGCVSFHREKYVASGGPDGGDGGRGGSIVLRVDDNLGTLMDFRYKRKYVAPDGAPGGNKRCSGRDGENLVIRVPRGTLIKDSSTGALIKDMSDDDPFVVCRGGNGGWGNCHFATPTRQAPRFAKSGLPGDEKEVMLELKLLADVGLVGFPNVGKSTMLSRLSAARPKIADYHFTTLAPNLGVVYVGEGQSFAMADIPGIIEGASEGAGLGHDFLRHIERCRLLVHVVDAAGSEGRDPLEDLDTINTELSRFGDRLVSLPQIIAANKCDLAPDEENLRRLRKRADELGAPFFEISAVSGAGLDSLKFAIWNMLDTLPPITVYEPDFIAPEVDLSDGGIYIEKDDEGVFCIYGPRMERLVGSVNFADFESRSYFERVLQNAGVYQMLEDAGVAEGDTVDVCGFRFEYVI